MDFFPSSPFASPLALTSFLPQLTAVTIYFLPLQHKAFTSLFPDFPQVLLSNEPIISFSPAIALITLSVQHLQQQPPDWKRTCFLKWQALPPPSKSTVEKKATELQPPWIVFQWQQRDVSAVRTSKGPWKNIVPYWADWKAAACPCNVYILLKLILNKQNK